VFTLWNLYYYIDTTNKKQPNQGIVCFSLFGFIKSYENSYTHNIMRILLNKYQLFKLKAVYNVLKMITSRYE